MGYALAAVHVGFKEVLHECMCGIAGIQVFDAFFLPRASSIIVLDVGFKKYCMNIFVLLLLYMWALSGAEQHLICCCCYMCGS